MKFFIDHQLPPDLVLWFRTKGHEAISARQSGLRSIDDATIWTHCSRQGFAVVTKDYDFVSLALTGDGPPVIWVRIGNAVNEILIARLEAAWPDIEANLISGARLLELR